MTREHKLLLRAIGFRLAELRIDRGWTQKDVAKRLRMAVRNVQSMELGQENFSLARLFRLAKFFKLPLISLLIEPEIRERRRGRPPNTSNKAATP